MTSIGRSSLCCLCLIICAGSVSLGTITDGVDYGPFISYRVAIPLSKSTTARPVESTSGSKKKHKKEIEPRSVVYKGITVSLDQNTSVCFDTDLMRYAALNTGLSDLTRYRDSDGKLANRPGLQLARIINTSSSFSPVQVIRPAFRFLCQPLSWNFLRGKSFRYGRSRFRYFAA